MNTRILVYTLSIVFSVDGFFDDFFGWDSDEDIGFDYFYSFGHNVLNSPRHKTARCYLFVNKLYLPGEFTYVVQTDSSTESLTSNNFISVERKYRGKEYTLTNTRILQPGYKCLRYTLGYFGWRIPNSWCFIPTENKPVIPSTTESPRTTTYTDSTTQSSAKTTEQTSSPTTIKTTTLETTVKATTTENIPSTSYNTVTETSAKPISTELQTPTTPPTYRPTTYTPPSSTTQRVLSTRTSPTRKSTTPIIYPTWKSTTQRKEATTPKLSTTTKPVQSSTTPRVLPTRKPLPSPAR